MSNLIHGVSFVHQTLKKICTTSSSVAPLLQFVGICSEFIGPYLKTFVTECYRHKLIGLINRLIASWA